MHLVGLEAALVNASEQMQQLATAVGRYKAFVPPRSHPSDGDPPPFKNVMYYSTAPIDHLAGLFKKFPSKTISSNPFIR